MRYFLAVFFLTVTGVAQQSPQVGALASLRPFSLPSKSDAQDVSVKCEKLANIGSIREEDYQVAADDTLADLPGAAHVCVTFNLSKIKDPALADTLDRTINVAVFSVHENDHRLYGGYYGKLVGQYNQLVQNYNQLLSQYQVALTQANRRDRAVAIWQAWQAAHPAPQTIQLNVCTNPFGCPK